MANKDKSSERPNGDILQCKADIMRARDIMPPHDKITNVSSDSQQVDKNTNHSAPAKVSDFAPIPVETIEHKPADSPTVNPKPVATSQHDKSEIPKFDLAEDIMAEHRRITAIKRKAPAKRIEAVNTLSAAGSGGSARLLQWPKSPAQEKIIAEIVARDIEKLCRGNILTTGNRLKDKQ